MWKIVFRNRMKGTLIQKENVLNTMYEPEASGSDCELILLKRHLQDEPFQFTYHMKVNLRFEFISL